MALFGPDQWVAERLQMWEIACHCPDPDCDWKKLDDIAHARSMLFYRRVGELIREFGPPVEVRSGQRCHKWNADYDIPRPRYIIEAEERETTR